MRSYRDYLDRQGVARGPWVLTPLDASVDGRRMAETALEGSGRSPTSAVGEAETPNPSEEQPQ